MLAFNNDDDDDYDDFDDDGDYGSDDLDDDYALEVEIMEAEATENANNDYMY